MVLCRGGGVCIRNIRAFLLEYHSRGGGTVGNDGDGSGSGRAR